jgi:hypothetical protein
MTRALWLVLLVSTLAMAAPIVPMPVQYNQCVDLGTPSAIPPSGKQLLYCKNGAGWCAKDSAGTERCTGAGGGGGHTIADEGVNLAAESILNFVGAGVTCADNAGVSTICTIPGGGGPITLSQLPDASPADLCLRSGDASDPAYEPCQPEVIITNAPYLADATGVVNATTAFETALAANKHVLVPAGTYTLCDMDANQQSGQVLQCEPGAILKPTAGCGGNPVIMTSTAKFADGVTIKGCTIRSETSNQGILADGRSVRNLRITDTIFDMTGSGPRGITVQGIDGFELDHSFFLADAGASGTLVECALIQRGMRDMSVHDNQFIGCSNSITVNDDGFNMEEMRFGPNNYFDMLWPWRAAIPATNCSGAGINTCDDSGAGISYVDNTTNVVLTDTTAAFPAFSVDDTLLVLPVRASGTITSATPFGTRLDDTGAGFVVAGVKDTDYIETATAWSTVLQVIDATHLYTTGWRSRTTFKPVAAPGSATAYTIYRTLLGRIASNTATTITVGPGTFSGLLDMFGADIAGTPPVVAGTRYRVVAHPNYHLNIESGAKRVHVFDSAFFHGWSDMINLTGDDSVVENNTFDGGQDGCLTPNGARHLIQGNTFRRCGAAGIHGVGTDLVINGNVFVDNVWSNNANTTGLGDIRCVASATITDNTIKRIDAGMVLGKFGVAVQATSTGCSIDHNTFGGHATNEVTILAGAAGTKIGDNAGLTLADAGTGTSKPVLNTVFAGPPSGSTVIPTFRSLVDTDVPNILTLDLPGSPLTGAVNNSILIGTGAGTAGYQTLPACSNGTTDKLLYNNATHAVTCGVDQNSGGGGGGTVTSVSCTAPMVCSPAPIIAAGSVALDTTLINDTTFGNDTDAQMAWTFDTLGTNVDLVFASQASGQTAVLTGNHATQVSINATNAGAGVASLVAHGSGGGDAQSKYIVSTGRTWLVGEDASAANGFAIATDPTTAAVLGTNNVFACTTAGACSFPDADGVTITGPFMGSGTLSLRSAASPDLSTSLWNGNGVQLGASGVPDVLYATKGDLALQGTYYPFMMNYHDSDDWTVNKATCTADAATNAACTASGVGPSNFPMACCTGAGTGTCGYCNGNGLAVLCNTTEGTTTNSTCFPAVGYFSHWYHKIDFANDSMPLEGFYVGVFGPTITGSGSGTRTITTVSGITDVPTVALPAATTNLAVTSTNGFSHTPVFSRPDGGSQTGTIGTINHLLLGGAAISAGWADTNYVPISIGSPGGVSGQGTGTIATGIGIDIADQTMAATAMSLRSTGAQTFRHEGSGMFGAITAPGARLEVRQANATTPAILVGYGGTAYTSASTAIRNMIENNETVTMAPTGNNAHTLRMIEFAPTVTAAAGAAGDTISLTGLDYNPTTTDNINITPIVIDARGNFTNTATSFVGPMALKVSWTSTSNTANISPTTGFAIQNAPTFKYNVASGTGTTTSGLAVGYNDITTFQNVQAGGTFSVVEYDSYKSTPTFTQTAGTLTVGTRRGVHIANMTRNGTPTVTTQVGVEIDALSNATTNLGIRNAAPTAFTPSTVQTIAVGTTILCNATVVMLQSTGNVGPLTSSPQIADGADGQICILVNVDSTDTITLESAGGNLRLPGGLDLALGPADSVTLLFSTTLGDWVAIAQVNI